LKHVINITVVLLLVFASVQNAGAQDSIPRKAEKVKSYTLTPMRASMFASALPGLGQIYNRKYWKVPVVYAGFGALGYFVVFNSTNFNKYMTAYQDFTDNVPGTNSYTTLSFVKGMDPSVYDPILKSESFDSNESTWVKENILNGVSYYRKYRNLSYIGVAAWYLITILDANVDASLFDYDISEDLRATVAPMTVSPYGLSPGISFTLIKNF
jgi:hypothetical protein